MIDFIKHGFTIKEIDGKKCDDESVAYYENELLEIQHWRKPNIYVIGFRRERVIEWNLNYFSVVEANKMGLPNTGKYVIKEGISDSERKLAETILSGNSYTIPLYIGAITGETFFEILLHSVCSDADKLIQCGS